MKFNDFPYRNITEADKAATEIVNSELQTLMNKLHMASDQAMNARDHAVNAMAANKIAKLRKKV